MNRIFLVCLPALLLCAAPLFAQDGQSNAAAIASRQEAEENYNILKGKIEDLIAAQSSQQKRLQEMAREMTELRQQSSKPNTTYATQEDVKQLTQAIQEIDKKREADKELILKEIEKLGKAISVPVSRPNRDRDRDTGGTRSNSKPPSDSSDTGSTPPVDPNQPGYYYVIKKDDYLSSIAQAYREQGVKVTTKQILDANPGLNPGKLIVGKKIFIPGTKSK